MGRKNNISYHKIHNLYSHPEWLNLFKRVYVSAKIHGTSAHIHFDNNGLRLFSGGGKPEVFKKLFNEDELLKIYKEFYDGKTLTLYGEFAGASMQAMSHTYGK